ncbi:hypothetical protein AK830_g2373 [Neonectria ditissima]|uniref:Uncharacterized protein n=1 Tax=Neonectria ditissima TaxID=78410 RepID=A0A0P7BKD4_9HYPO|nr:hypothetical protein AK830_g2373 [Neonectria ditissima]
MDALDAVDAVGAPGPGQRQWEANQNACLLPFQYARFLVPEIAQQDAMYALGDVFRVSAAAEQQFLNLMQSLLDREMEPTLRGPFDGDPMLDLRYYKKIVDEHTTRIAQTLLLLRSRDELNWPRAPAATPQGHEAARFTAMLYRDFAYLHQRAESLSDSLQNSMQSLANNATFQESVKAVANAERVERLTLLATIFLPLTFTCSAFGMNFSAFGQGELSLWIYAPTAAVVITFSFLLWHLGGPRYRLRELLR